MELEPVKIYRTYLAGCNAYFVNFIVGTCIGWSSPTVPKLRDHTADSPLDHGVTSEQEGWISSILSLGSLIGSVTLALLNERIGRKTTLLLNSSCFVVAYALLMAANKLWIIYVARAIQGVGIGVGIATVPMYAGEITTDDCRGAISTIGTFLMASGILYSYIIGPYVSYMVLQWCCIIMPVAFVATFIFMPESPYYFAMKGRHQDGIKSLQFLRGQSAKAAEAEMNKIQIFVDEAMANKGGLSAMFLNRGNRKALFICCSLLAFQQLSGTTAVTFNCQSIFGAAKTTIDPPLASIILVLVQLVPNSLTPFIVDRAGRKVLALISSIGMTIALFALGTFFYIQTYGDATEILWMPIPALVLFNTMYAFGIGPVPWTLLCEMFPSNIKSNATSLACSTCWIVGFLATRWFPELNALGPFYAFWMFGSFCVVASFFVIFVMIETKGMSFEQIQKKLQE